MLESKDEIVLQILTKLQLLEQKIENLEKTIKFNTLECFRIKDLDYS